MKREERTKLVEDIRDQVRGAFKTPDVVLLRQAADCIAQLENELDKIHEELASALAKQRELK